MTSPAASAPRAKPAPGTTPAGSAGLLGGFRLIPAFERDPGYVTFACTTAGKLYLLGLFGMGLAIQNGARYAVILSAILGGATFLPQHRRLVLVSGVDRHEMPWHGCIPRLPLGDWAFRSLLTATGKRSRPAL